MCPTPHQFSLLQTANLSHEAVVPHQDRKLQAATPVWSLFSSPWGLEKSVHVKPKYSRRKGEKRTQKEYAERQVIRLRTTTEIIKQRLPPLQSAMLKPQPTNTLHSPIPFRPQITHLKRQHWIHLYSVPPPNPLKSCSQPRGSRGAEHFLWRWHQAWPVTPAQNHAHPGVRDRARQKPRGACA